MTAKALKLRFSDFFKGLKFLKIFFKKCQESFFLFKNENDQKNSINFIAMNISKQNSKSIFSH
jgi:hypothetical protein